MSLGKLNGKKVKIIKWWQKLLVSVLVIGVIIMVVVILLSTRTVPKVSKQICTTPACLKAATHLLKYIDDSVDPCDDFFKFACGRFIKDTPNSSRLGSLVVLQKQYEEELDKIIKQPIRDGDHYLVKLQKTLMDGCLNQNITSTGSIEVFEEMVKELNGWPVVVGYEWMENRFDWKEIIYKLRQKGYFSWMLLEIGIAIDPSGSNKYMIKIDLPNTVWEDNYSNKYYIDHMVEIVTNLGADKELAETEMKKVLDFIKEVQKIIIGNKSKIDEKEITIMTIENIQTKYQEIDWLELINNFLFPSATISYQDKIMFPKGASIKNLLSFVTKTPKRIQANYIFWKVVEYIHPFLIQDLKQSPKDRLELCKQKINPLFFPEPAEILHVRTQLPLEKRKQIYQLIRMIKHEFISLLMGASWMDYQTKIKAAEKAHSVTAILGTIGDYFDDSIFERHEPIKKKVFQNDTFLKMYLARIKEQADASYSRIHNPISHSLLGTIHRFLKKALAFYVANHNLLLLPVGILQEIMYSNKKPMYLNFGTLGSIIGHELTHGFCKQGSDFNKLGRKENMWSLETQNAYEHEIKCMLKNAAAFPVANTTRKINGIQTIEENISDYTGIKVAYSAYESWIRKHGEEDYLPVLNYTPKQLFWVSAVNYHCYELDKRMTKIIMDRDKHALNVFRAIEPLRNNKNFGKDFNCPVGSRMNPKIKCQVF